MNRARFVGSTAAGVAALLGATKIARSADQERSMWVWKTPLDNAADVGAFAQKYQIRTLFFSVPKTDLTALEAGNARALATLINLKRGGLEVYGVAGDPSWVTKSRTTPPATVATLVNLHQAHGVFDGIALDLEPHTLPQWKDESQKATLAANYLAVLGVIHSAASAANVPLLATVHPTYAKYTPPNAGQTLLQSAARAVDATDLMAYRNSEKTLESFGGQAMEQLAGVSKGWWLGVSTHTDAAAGTSYATVPASQFMSAITATSSDLERRYGHGFKGISIEDYSNTAALLR